jgi:hypothetical protein
MQLSKKSKTLGKYKLEKKVCKNKVSDPDPHWIRISGDPGSGSAFEM